MVELSTKSGIFETGVKDEYGVAYKDCRVVGSYDKHLTEYTVKDGTEVICDRAFYDKKELCELHLPSSVKAIGESAFASCKALESVNIPEGVAEIRTSTFRDCKSLRRLELPASCTRIAKWAFTDGIETLICNAPAMQIDKSAFLSCKTLKTVLVPEGCINAYAQAFLPCGFIPRFEEMNEETIPEEEVIDSSQKEKLMNKENSKLWVRLYPEGESVKVYKVGTSSEEETDTLEDPRWELYFGSPGYEIRYELSEDDSYLDGSVEDGYFESDSCIRISKIISAINAPDSANNDDKIREIKEIFQHPRFGTGVTEVYKRFIKYLSHPGISEEDAILSLFKNVIKECDISNPVGIEVDGTEEEAFKVGYFINTSVNEFDPHKLLFLSFDCWFEGLSSAFGYMEGVTQCILNLVIYDGIIYANSDIDDGFYDGCENSEVFLVNGENMQEYETD